MILLFVVAALLVLKSRSSVSPTTPSGVVAGGSSDLSHVFNHDRIERPENGTQVELHAHETETFLRTTSSKVDFLDNDSGSQPSAPPPAGLAYVKSSGGNQAGTNRVGGRGFFTY